MAAFKLFSHPYAVFFALGVALFLISEVGSGTFARASGGEEDLIYVFTDVSSGLILYPWESIIIYSPFLFLSWIAASLAAQKNLGIGMVLFLIGGLFLAIIYITTNLQVEDDLRRKMWTAASITSIMAPLKSIPVLLICLGLRIFLGRNKTA